ncbi:MAG: hypothetical protein OXU24_04815, partial [Gammaproteobacteria bacterium]|nr:hypothetical protein [Gammaproteobacteria bacterium]
MPSSHRATAAFLTAIATVLFSLGASAQQPDQVQVTYSDHVAPILYDNCVKCHRAGGVGPMSLVTYDEVRPWA